ncbi:Ankyrin repeats containing protein [Cardinium endosymbiont of Sogatella furcifera]|uniref:ankyrin repeat domain-containing protein n=1 Tax=Cardinium endosymbiont of Sogatella furcifera TaxID=650378 RepID=UPI000E0D2C03|nr:ankyrin repeat domain-containing protein [Cardinium endosymbiont of Sogatella furcifera]AXI24111.1 Ankyrin repeats containing protein [Cardinium endosymbiont of Sogatella furcifera]
MKTYIKYSLGLLRMLLTLNTLFACVRTQQGMDTQEKSSPSAIDKPLDTQQGVDAQENPLDSVVDKHVDKQRTALGRAIKKDDCSAVQVLLGYERTDINNAGGDVTSLILALTSGNPDIAAILLNYSGSQTLDVMTPDPESGKGPLYLAAQKGYVEVVTLLLDPKYKDKVDVDAKDKDGNTALYVAARDNKASVVELLKSVEADVNLKGDLEMTPLIVACYGGNLAAVNALLKCKNDNDKKININAVDKEQRTALHRAAHQGNLEIINALLGVEGIEIKLNETDESGNTALHLAIYASQEEAAKRLIEAGVDVTIKNYSDKTPLMVAQDLALGGIIEALLKVL